MASINDGEFVIDKNFFTSDKTQLIMYVFSYTSLLISVLIVGGGYVKKFGFSNKTEEILKKIAATLVLISCIILLIGTSIKLDNINQNEKKQEIYQLVQEAENNSK